MTPWSDGWHRPRQAAYGRLGPVPGPLPQLHPDDRADVAREVGREDIRTVPPLPGLQQRILHRVIKVPAGQAAPGAADKAAGLVR